MRNTKENRRTNLRALVEKVGSAQVCERAKMQRQQLSQYIGPNPQRGVGDPVARRIEQAFELPEHYLDFAHESSLLHELLEAAAVIEGDRLSALFRRIEALETTLMHRLDELGQVKSNVHPIRVARARKRAKSGT